MKARLWHGRGEALILLLIPIPLILVNLLVLALLRFQARHKSDAKVYPPMSDFLRDQGIEIAEGYAEANIPADADVVVIGNAISRGNPEVEWWRENLDLERYYGYQAISEAIHHYDIGNGKNYYYYHDRHLCMYVCM